MNTTQLECFVQVALNLSIRRAAEERARRRASGDGLVIAYSDSNELYRLAHVLDGLRRGRPGLHVQLRQGPRDANVAQLEREQVDVVLGFESQALPGAGMISSAAGAGDAAGVSWARPPETA